MSCAPLRQPPEDWKARQELTLELGCGVPSSGQRRGGRLRSTRRGPGLEPSSYADAVEALQKMGYRYIALGGMVPLKTPEIEACLRGVADVRQPETRLHLLGITGPNSSRSYERYGVTSFDSTSPFRQAFKDDRDNYYAPDRKYLALRVMQVDGNNRLKQTGAGGRTRPERRPEARAACLDAWPPTTEASARSMTPLAALAAYDSFLGEPDRQNEYWRTLEDRPWRSARVGSAQSRDPGRHLPRHRAQQAPWLPQPVRLQPTSSTRNSLPHDRTPRPRTPAHSRTNREIYSFGVDGKHLLASLPSHASGGTTTPPSAATSGPRSSRTSTRSARTSSLRRR